MGKLYTFINVHPLGVHNKECTPFQHTFIIYIIRIFINGHYVCVHSLLLQKEFFNCHCSPPKKIIHVERVPLPSLLTHSMTIFQYGCNLSLIESFY